MKINHSNTVLTYFLVIAVIAFNIIAYLTDTHNIAFKALYNSDSLYLATLYDDLFNNNGSLRNWHLPPAPYYFPDMLIYFFSQFVTGKTHFAILLFFLIQLIIVFIILKKLYELIFEHSTALIFASISIALLYLTKMGSANILRVSAHHYGEFIIGLIFMLLLTKIILSTKLDMIRYVILILISTLVIASDKLYIIHFIIPSIMTLTVFWLCKLVDLKKYCIISGTIIISTVCGLLLFHLLNFNPLESTIEFHIDNFSINLNHLVTQYLNSYQNNQTYVILSTAFYVILIFSLIFKRYTNTSIKFLSIFIVTCVFVNLTVVLMLNSPPTPRYYTPIAHLPFIYFPFLIHLVNINAKRKWLTYFLAIVLTSTIGTLFYLMVKTLKTNEIKTEYYPDYVQCFDDFIDETHSQSGISQYWLSKHISMLNKNNINVTQYFIDLKPRDWISTSSWQKENYAFVLVDNTDSPNFKYIINKIDTVNLRGRTYSHVYECDKFKIYYYKYGFAIY